MLRERKPVEETHWDLRMDMAQGWKEGVSNLAKGSGDNFPKEGSFLPRMRGIRRREQVKWFLGS